MPATLSYPGVYIEEVPSGVRAEVSADPAAFAATATSGAAHVQLAVIEGNRPAEKLYERLGFQIEERISMGKILLP